MGDLRRVVDAVTFGPVRRRRAMRRRLSALDDPFWTDVGRNRPARARRAARGLGEQVRTALAIVGTVTVVLVLFRGGTALDRLPFVGGSDMPTVESLPPLPSDAQFEPIGRPAKAPAGKGGYRFLDVQPPGDAPVAYDPCRPIRYVVRSDGAPTGADELLRDAIARVSAVTGLRFIDEGATTEAPSKYRALVDEARYGNRWAPVLISWATPEENPALAGDVAGEAGSNQIETAGKGSGRYVTGVVTLDGPQLAETLGERDGRTAVRSIIQHELGHLVGLDHIDDRRQLMYKESTENVTDFGPGDLRGLFQLGQGRCFRDA